jgi:spore coat protein H
MNKKIPLIILLLLSNFIRGHAQSAVFPNNGTLFDDQIHTIHILIKEADLIALEHKDSLWNNRRFPITFVYDEKDTVNQATIRLKGNTSRSSKKKSYRIDFDRIVNKQTFQGLETIHIHGNHNDASMIREFLSAYVMKKMNIPVNRVNHIKLFINGTYWGVRSMVEYIDKDFLKTRFGSNKGNNYKCTWPADLDWLGSNQNTYKSIINPSPLQERAYELKTNEDIDDYSRFVSLIDIINNQKNQSNFPQEIEKIFDVDTYLKALAAEVLIGHWDNYFYNKNNYFIYDNPNNQKFTYIPYDMDNTFGVHWGVSNIHIRNIHSWGNNMVYAPLTESLLARSEYQKRYEKYIYDAINDFYNEKHLFPLIDSIYKKLENAITLDPQYTGSFPSSYGYNFLDWKKSFSDGLGDHNAIGIKPFISNRVTTALQQMKFTHQSNSIKYKPLRCYPNPSEDILVLQFDSNEPLPLKLLNTSGMVVKNLHISSGEVIHTDDLPQGVYLIKAENHLPIYWLKQ